jgi:hypothetical protein
MLCRQPSHNYLYHTINKRWVQFQKIKNLNVSQSNDINNDPWLCTWLWMPTNQMTWTMIRDSAPDLNANQSKDINNDQWLSTWIWISANQMTFTMIRDSAPDWMPTNQITLTIISDSTPGFECQPIK